ncbi:limbic system-associated membrane protein-like [Halichoeres trimaculatus]|uniref:limbic system-associated membrane protein-like n=1 Tax=Halichoeres trimaculatus TaxID=147232 RepID=UPI003D9E3AE4
MFSGFKRLILIMKSTVLIILVIFPGAWSGSWGVVSKDQCAVRGSSVVIQCEYDYPSFYIVTAVDWYKRQSVSGKPKLVHLSDIPSAPDHFRYVGNKRSDCSLQINNVQSSDEGAYFFHFKTTFFNQWTSKRPALLTVTDLTAVVNPSTVTEGDNVHLTCVSDCPTSVDVVWFRDKQPVSKTVLQARREDAGMYSCAVLGQETVRSASVALNVQYAPRKVLLSLTPSSSEEEEKEVIVKGSSVTLTCSSDANPPVRQNGYTLYKDERYISRGENYTISDVQPSHSGLYHCQAWNNISRTGIHSFNSTEVHLDVQFPPVNVKVLMNPSRVTEGSGVNLTCSSSANPTAETYTWFRRPVSSSSSSLLQVGSGQMLSLSSVNESHTGLYLCQARNTLGGNNSTETLFDVSRGSLGSSVAEDQFDCVYANISVLPSSPPQAQTNQGDDVTYSTVTIKSRNPDPSHMKNENRAGEVSRSRRGGNEESVIYSTLSKSS